MMMNDDVWAHPLEVAVFEILANAIRIALQKSILSEDDLFKDDAFVYGKLKASGDKKIQRQLEMLNPKLKIEDNPEDYDFYCETKLRWIDPKFLRGGGKVLRLSDVSESFRKDLEAYKQRMLKGTYIKIISW